MAWNRRKKQDEETTYWLSYSDMMAGLLLVFVLIISITVLHSNILYDAKQEELAGKENQLIIQSEELENERLLVEQQGAKLNAQELKLSEQEGKLAEQAGRLKKQASELAEQELKLGEQQMKLAEQEALLDELQSIMYAQQEQLDKIIGIRTELVEALKREFESSDLNIAVDEKTGAITLDSSILYEYNKDDLKSGGKEFLGAFMPRYTKILLSPEYSPYISEIIIEGHTDTSGTYLFNLDLSQKRAYSVADFCLSDDSRFLTPEEKKIMAPLLSVTGKSFSNPVYNEDGTVNAEKSRRVEILFRLKDEEMIREMVEILSESGETVVSEGPGEEDAWDPDEESDGGPGGEDAGDGDTDGIPGENE